MLGDRIHSRDTQHARFIGIHSRRIFRGTQHMVEDRSEPDQSVFWCKAGRGLLGVLPRSLSWTQILFCKKLRWYTL
jgi:hypothetical protein